MTAPAISPAPWDLRSGEKWKIRSADRDQYGDHNSEVVVDAKGNVVAYVSGFNDEGGNGQLLRAAPDYALLLAAIVADHAHWEPFASNDGRGEICVGGLRYATRLDAVGCPRLDVNTRVALLKQAGAL